MIPYSDFVRLLTDVSEFENVDDYIAECGGSVPLDDMEAVIRLLTLIWTMGHDGLTIRKVADVCGMSVRQLSTEMGVSYHTTSKWAMGVRTAPDWTLLMVTYAALSNLILGDWAEHKEIIMTKPKDLTYGELFSKFAQQHPEIAVDDYRPAPGGYAITVWEKGTHNVYVARYQPDNDSFTITKSD